MPDIPLAPKVFDRALIGRHLRRRPPGHDDFVTRLLLADLEERLGTVTRTFEQALIMSPDASVLPRTGRSADGPFRYERVSTVLPATGAPLVDPEILDLPRRGYDLIVSLFDLDVVDDVPGFLARARAHLRGDGLFLAAAIGGESLTELREAFLTADAQLSGGAFLRVAPFIPLSAAAGLLQRAGLALPVSDVETHIVRYEAPLSLMRELKELGASNPLADRPHKMATLSLIKAASAAYEALASDSDGRVRATLEIVWLSGWAPHESQQKPLKPGSAQVSLAQVLKTKN
ncbi:MAG: SAM-dependent methyltransferase [Devosia sp.]